jgi:hypothetical protein
LHGHALANGCDEPRQTGGISIFGQITFGPCPLKAPTKKILSFHAQRDEFAPDRPRLLAADQTCLNRHAPPA